nr:hypothetical protein [Bacteroidaceae bacterium]
DDHPMKRTAYKHYAALRKLVEWKDGMLVMNPARIGQHFYASRHEENAKQNRSSFLNYMYKITLAQEERARLVEAQAEALRQEEVLPTINAQERNMERFHFVHPEIENDEAWRIHEAVKRLVVYQKVPEICTYLRELKQKGKVMLPSNAAIMYNELVRLGMPTGEGYSEKHFSNSYTK